MTNKSETQETPFFARYLEGQDLPQVKTGIKAGRRGGGGGGGGSEPIDPPLVTLKYPSDDDEDDFFETI